jgi:hypothetical protein
LKLSGGAALWFYVCEKDDASLNVTVDEYRDGGQSLDEIRMNVGFACPHRLADIQDTGSDQRVQRACDTPVSQRDESQQRLAEVMGCA